MSKQRRAAGTAEKDGAAEFVVAENPGMAACMLDEKIVSVAEHVMARFTWTMYMRQQHKYPRTMNSACLNPTRCWEWCREGSCHGDFWHGSSESME